MQLNLMILDDFFDNADQLREAALRLQYPETSEKTYFPGRNANGPINIPGMDDMISRMVGEKLRPAPGTSHGVFRMAMEGDEGAGNVHIDECHWSGIFYLTPDEHANGGTDFYRHKATGTDHAPYTPQQLDAIGLKQQSDIWDKILIPDSNNMDAWEHLMRVPMKYNRLILFRPWYYHNAGPSFGSTPETARLILPLFYVSDGPLGR